MPRLVIPAIAVDASIESVGMTPSGAVGVPKGPTNAAWFNLGPRPGEAGTSIIDGHFGWKDDIPAVFDSLDQVRPGDKVYVTNGRGVTTTFVVRAIRRYGEYEDAIDVFAAADARAHLNLITCGGVWNEARKSYSDRLVVFTDKQ